MKELDKKKENYKYVLCIYLYVLYNPPLSRIYIALSDCLAWCRVPLRWQSVVDVWNYPSAFRVYYNNVPVTLDDSCSCKTFTYSLNYYSYLSSLYMTTERKSICVANRNEFGADLDISAQSHTFISLYFTSDPHVLSLNLHKLFSVELSNRVLSWCDFILHRQ